MAQIEAFSQLKTMQKKNTHTQRTYYLNGNGSIFRTNGVNSGSGWWLNCVGLASYSGTFIIRRKSERAKKNEQMKKW